MKYKFKPQTGLLVAGLLAASYANACLYQATAVKCVASGDTIDTIYWNSDYSNYKSLGLGSQPVTATQDWWVTANGSSGYLSYQTTGHGTNYTNYRADNGTVNTKYCSGPAQFKDFSLHSTSVTWVPNTANSDGLAATYGGLINNPTLYNMPAPYQIYSPYVVNGVVTLVSGGADTTSSTCQQ